MKWRVMLELVGPDGTVGVHEVGGRAAVAEYVPQMIGLTLEEGKHLQYVIPPEASAALARPTYSCCSHLWKAGGTSR
jgi:hypothetical protein